MSEKEEGKKSSEDLDQTISQDAEKRKIEEKPVKKEEATGIKAKIARIPWREFLRSQFRKLLGITFILALMVRIITLSDKLTTTGDVNQDNIILVNNSVNFEILVLSTVVFALVLIFFSKIVFFDHKEDFGIESYKSVKAILFFLLTIAFISLVFILFDVALNNVYLQIFPVYLLQSLRTQFDLRIYAIEDLPIESDLIAYSEIRGLLFVALFAFMLSFPLAMTIVILTRYGREKIKERKEKPREKYTFKEWVKFLSTLPLLFVLLAIFFAISALNLEVPIQFLVLFGMIIIGVWWLTQFLILVIRAMRLASFLLYSNLAMIIPIIFLFYILPGIIWATWDMYAIFRFDSTDHTIYTADGFDGIPAIDPEPSEISLLSTEKVLEFFFQTFVFNLGDPIRIIELDFIFIIGLSSIVIGFAEGYSIVAIVRSISTGVSIARSGRVATRSSPKLIVLTTRFILLLTWMTLLYDKFIVIYTNLVEHFGVDLPDLTIPRIFEVLFGVTVDLENLGGVFIAVSLLIVPLYFIITSSFKFLSVSIVAEKMKGDTQAFFFLISSAFILIISQILADIAALDEFKPADGDDLPGKFNGFLPLNSLNTRDAFSFVSNIFEGLESIGFYIGAIFSLFLLLKLLLLKIIGR
ncbi:MAG: hypothetical protein GPJ54_05500 [Candidatus Heimdallarchaeota archaeon]|nr:hypothetical protein [Candidatus Heimdallarchaeota archaeon]